MWLPPVVTSPPAGEPVSIEEARAQCNVEEGCTDYDPELGVFIAAARGQAEDATGTAIISQTVLMRASGFCDLKRMPLAPLQAEGLVIKYLDGEGVEQTLDPSAYELVPAGLRPFIRLKPGQSWPGIYAAADAVRVFAVAGYGAAADQPPGVKLAQLLSVGEWFKNRETSTAVDALALPNAARALLDAHRRWRGM